MLLVSPETESDVEGQEHQNDTPLSLTELVGLPEEVTEWVLGHAEGVLEEPPFVAAINCFLGHLTV
jgi:hypothetical protein